MTSPIKIFSHSNGPNSWRINIILDELNIPYELEFKEFGELHVPEFEKYTPNGRYDFTSLDLLDCSADEKSAVFL